MIRDHGNVPNRLDTARTHETRLLDRQKQLGILLNIKKQLPPYLALPLSQLLGLDLTLVLLDQRNWRIWIWNSISILCNEVATRSLCVSYAGA